MILNQSFEPVTVCSTKKALILLLLTKADMVEKRDGIMVHSVNRNFPCPSVIKLSAFVRVPYKKIELSRKNIHRRDGYRCQYCGNKVANLTIDHIVPKSRGGYDSWENLVSACIKCNNQKGSRTPEEAKMKLMSVPSRPHHILFMKQFMGNIENTWKPFLFMD